jgi:response regulator RpfG family c-di-GMP phosphodiesterase
MGENLKGSPEVRRKAERAETVLLLDDEESIRRLISEYFDRYKEKGLFSGVNLETFADPDVFLERCQEIRGQFALGIVDYDLGVTTTGLDVLRIISADQLFEPPPQMVMLTGNRAFIDLPEVYENGATLVAAKPIGMPELMAIIEGQLTIYRRMRELINSKEREVVKHETLARIMNQGVWSISIPYAKNGEVDLDNIKVQLTPTWYRLVGQKKPEGDSSWDDWAKHVFNEDKTRVEKELIEGLKKGVPKINLKFRMITTCGDIVHCVVTGTTTTKDSAGRTTEMIGVLTDETETTVRRENRMVQDQLFSKLLVREITIDDACTFTVNSLLEIGDLQAGAVYLLSEGGNSFTLKCKNARKNTAIDQVILKQYTQGVDHIDPKNYPQLLSLFANSQSSDTIRLEGKNSTHTKIRSEIDPNGLFNNQDILITPLRNDRHQLIGFVTTISKGRSRYPDAVNEGLDGVGRSLAMSLNLILKNAEIRAINEELQNIAVLLEHDREAFKTKTIELARRLAVLVEKREETEVGDHINEVAEMAICFAEALENDPEIEEEMKPSRLLDKEYSIAIGDWREIYKIAAMLHDIGKVGIPDMILLKPGILTKKEYTIMKTHADLGGEMLDINDSIFKLFRDVAKYHHDYLNGRGYHGKTDISWLIQIVSIIDMFSAMLQNRVYSPPKSKELAVAIINGTDDRAKKEDKNRFDPNLLRVFNRISDKLYYIHERLVSEKNLEASPTPPPATE